MAVGQASPSNTVTVTGSFGPGSTATAAKYTNVTRLDLDFDSGIYTIYHDGNKVSQFRLSDVTGITTTIANTNVAGGAAIVITNA